MNGRLSSGFGDFAGRIWLNTAHQGAMPLAAAKAARQAVSWKVDPSELTVERFDSVPRRLRAALSTLVNGRPDDIVLSNSASYGLHLIANAFPWAPGDETLVMEGDFPSDILPWMPLQQRLDVRVRRVRPRQRIVTADELAAAITPRTRLFCTAWVHSFSGCVADLHALGEICHAGRPAHRGTIAHPGRGAQSPRARRPVHARLLLPPREGFHRGKRCLSPPRRVRRCAASLQHLH